MAAGEPAEKPADQHPDSRVEIDDVGDEEYPYAWPRLSAQGDRELTGRVSFRLYGL